MTKPKFINSIKELGKAYRDERRRTECPWCKSLKNVAAQKELCDRHQERWIKIRVDESFELEGLS